jgi:hypothetical protein
MSNVIPLGCVTKLDLPVERVLEAAKERLESVVLVGWDTEGELYFASTIADGGDVNWLLDKAKQALLAEDLSYD